MQFLLFLYAVTELGRSWLFKTYYPSLSLVAFLTFSSILLPFRHLFTQTRSDRCSAVFPYLAYSLCSLWVLSFLIPFSVMIPRIFIYHFLTLCINVHFRTIFLKITSLLIRFVLGIIYYFFNLHFRRHLWKDCTAFSALQYKKISHSNSVLFSFFLTKLSSFSVLCISFGIHVSLIRRAFKFRSNVFTLC